MRFYGLSLSIDSAGHQVPVSAINCKNEQEDLHVPLRSRSRPMGAQCVESWFQAVNTQRQGPVDILSKC